MGLLVIPVPPPSPPVLMSELPSGTNWLSLLKAVTRAVRYKDSWITVALCQQLACLEEQLVEEACNRIKWDEHLAVKDGAVWVWAGSCFHRLFPFNLSSYISILPVYLSTSSKAEAFQWAHFCCCFLFFYTRNRRGYILLLFFSCSLCSKSDYLWAGKSPKQACTHIALSNVSF